MEEKEAAAQTAQETKPELNIPGDIYEWLQSVIFALVLGIVLFMFAGRVVRVDGSSMYPTLHNNDLVLTSSVLYTPKAGDIVVFHTPSSPAEPLVKRIIATEGQTVSIDFDSGTVYVDGVALEEPYINELTYTEEDFPGRVTVPAGCLFVMGDNRNHSRDSRSDSVSFVDARQLIGKVQVILFPAEDEGKGRDFSRIGSVY